MTDAVEGLYECIDKGFDFISSSHGGSKFGFGLSGGLDSRIILPFVKKYDMDSVAFKIGRRYLRKNRKTFKNLIAHDYKLSEKLARTYGVEHFSVEYDSEPIEKKVSYILDKHTFGYHNFNYANYSGLPKFDILIGAGNPHPISRVGSEYDNYNTNDMAKAILNNFSLILNKNISNERRYRNKYINNIYELFIKSLDKVDLEPSIDTIPGIINQCDVERIENKLKLFVEKQTGRKNIEIYETYKLHQLASKNYHGGFESIMGLKKAYTIYYPFCFEFLLSVPPKYLKGRAILKELNRIKFPKMSKIPLEGNIEPLNQSNLFQYKAKRRINHINMITRGYGFPGVGMLDNLETKSYLNMVLNRKNDLFPELFDVGLISQISLNRKLQLIKVKAVLDTILYKEWDNYLKNG